jgi:hypothetical protein
MMSGEEKRLGANESRMALSTDDDSETSHGEQEQIQLENDSSNDGQNTEANFEIVEVGSDVNEENVSETESSDSDTEMPSVIEAPIGG